MQEVIQLRALLLGQLKRLSADELRRVLMLLPEAALVKDHRPPGIRLFGHLLIEHREARVAAAREVIEHADLQAMRRQSGAVGTA